MTMNNAPTLMSPTKVATISLSTITPNFKGGLSGKLNKFPSTWRHRFILEHAAATISLHNIITLLKLTSCPVQNSGI
jgi:hypothetical protein